MVTPTNATPVFGISFPTMAPPVIPGGDVLKDLENLPKLELPEFGSQLHAPHSHPPTLGVNLDLGSSPAALSEEINRSPTWKEFLQSGEPKHGGKVGELYLEAFSKMTKTPFNHAHDIAKAGHEISKAVDDSEKNGISETEALVCKTVKEGTSLLVNEVGIKVLEMATMGYLAGCVEDPPLAVTIPVVAPLVVQGVDNVEHISDFAGKKAESKCHKLFSEHGEKD